MTTNCLPCELAAAEEAAVEDVSNTGGKRAAWSGPIGIENQRTGDGRLIESNALRWDTLPIPLRWAMQDFGAHDGAYVVGKIEAIERIDVEEANKRLQASGRDALPESFKDAVIIWGSGTHDLGSEYGREAFRQTDEGLTPGISMDLDDIVVRDEGDDEFTITEGRVRAATQVAIPAFEGARIAVSREATETFDPAERLEDLSSLTTEDSFNWVDDVGGLPQYIKRIEKHLEKKGMTESEAIATAVNVVKKMCATGDVNFPGAQQVNAGSRAEACAAVADWERKKAQAHASSGQTITASAKGWTPPHEWFSNPNLKGDTHWTVTDDGRVYGYVALWGTCHIANPQGHGICTQPPSSPTDYSYFNTKPVKTTDGFVYTGRITVNTLHAGARLSSNDAIHHYEHTGAVGAYVVAGEDEYGIWVAGAAHPDADLESLRAAPVSGDWRTIGKGLEMVGVLAVNVPGFPIPRPQAMVASGTVTSLVASGVVEREERHEAVQTLDLSNDLAVKALRNRFREMDRADAAAALAAKVTRLAALEKVRRLQSSLPPRRKPEPRKVPFSARFRSTFGYNEGQWRNPDNGRWIDMPGVAGQKISDYLASMEGMEVAKDELDSSIAAFDNAPEAEKADLVDDIKNAIEVAASSTPEDQTLNEMADEAGVALDAYKNSYVPTEGSDIGAGDDVFDAAGYVDISDDPAAMEGFEGAVQVFENPDTGLAITKNEDGGWSAYDEETGTSIGGAETPEEAVNLAEQYYLDNDGDPSLLNRGTGGEDPLGLADLLGEAGLDADTVDRVATSGVIQDEDNFDDTWTILSALPEGTEVRSGTDDLWVDWKKDQSVEGGWVVTGVGDGMADDFKVGDGLQGDSASLDGGGDVPVVLKDKIDPDSYKAPAETGDIGLDYSPHSGLEGPIKPGDRVNVATKQAPGTGLPLETADGEVIGRGDGANTIKVRLDDGTEVDIGYGGLKAPSGGGGGTPNGKDGKPLNAGDKVHNSVDPSQSGTVVEEKDGLVVVQMDDGDYTASYRPDQLVHAGGPKAAPSPADSPGDEAPKKGDTIDDPDPFTGLDLLPVGSRVEIDDGEFTTTIVKQKDGSWKATKSTLEDNVGASTKIDGKQVIFDPENPYDQTLTVKSIGKGEVIPDPNPTVPPDITGPPGTPLKVNPKWKYGDRVEADPGGGKPVVEGVIVGETGRGMVKVQHDDGTVGEYGHGWINTPGARADYEKRIYDIAATAEKAPWGISQADWDSLTPEQKAAVAKIMLEPGYTSPADIIKRVKGMLASSRVAKMAALLQSRGYSFRTMRLAYNPDQWRVPKGNGELSGRFIDMPDSLVDDLSNVLSGAIETAADVDEADAGRMGESLDKAFEAAKRASDALKGGDGDGAKAAAAEADDALSSLEAQLQDAADSGAINADTAANIGDTLAETRDGVGTLKDADLSLLGDEGIGGDAPQTDIGGEDKSIVGDAPEAPKAEAPDVTPEADKPKVPGATAEDKDGDGKTGDEETGSAQQKASKDMRQAADLLESVLFDTAESDGLTDEQHDTIGRQLEDLMRKMDQLHVGIQDGEYNAGDLAAAQTALSQFEALLMSVADGPGWTDQQANDIGQRLDDLFASLGNLAGLLQGDTNPPPFSTRKYVRQWLGRRGIRIGRKPTIMV